MTQTIHTHQLDRRGAVRLVLAFCLNGLLLRVAAVQEAPHELRGDEILYDGYG